MIGRSKCSSYPWLELSSDFNESISEGSRFKGNGKTVRVTGSLGSNCS